VNKRILFGVLMICAVAALVAIGTWAYFSDYETSYDNKFTAGSLDLKVDGMDDPTVATYFNVECVKPGDSGLVEIKLSNVGCVDGIADIHLLREYNDENVALEPELNAGDVADVLADLWDGELSQNLDMRISADLDNIGGYETVVAEGKLQPDLASINWIIGALDADSTIGLLIEWWVAPEVGNIIMTDTVKFDIIFSLNQAVGEPFEPHLSNLVQPATAVVCDTVTITVDVTNAGDIGGSVTVSLAIGALPPMQKLVSLAGGETKTATFTWHAEPAGEYDVVASIPSESLPPLTITVLEPGLLVVTGIQQVPMIQICESLTVAVDVHNTGGVSAEGIAWVVVSDALGTILFGPVPVPTGLIDPCETVKLPLTIGHVEESWRGMVFVVAGMVPSEVPEFICPLGVLKPATLEVTGIQQPTLVQPCEMLSIAVDVHNAGDKPLGPTPVTLTITNEGGTVVYSATEPTGTLAPCVTAKVAFPPVHVEESWLGTCTVTTSPALPAAHTIEVAGAGVIEVTGIQQPPQVNVCDTLPIAVDVHNAGGKPVAGSVTLTIISEGGATLVTETKATGTLAPCSTVKVAFGPYHPTEEWAGVCTVITTPPLPAPHEILVVVPPPGLDVSSKWWYDVNYALGTAAGETISAVVTEALTLGPVSITVKYVDQDGNINNFAPAITIPANSGIGTVVPIPLLGSDTGVRDIQAASYTPLVALTTGVVAIVGNSSGILGGSVDLKLIAAYYTDGMAFYVLEDTVMTTHLVQLNVAISDMLTECTQVTVPPGPADHAVIDPSMGGLLPPVRALPGTPYSMATMTIDAWASPSNGTSEYVYLTAMLLGIFPMEVEVGYHTYILTGGTNIGEPYAVGNSWTYIAETEAYALAPPCTGYSAVTITVSVVAGNVSVTVPKGTFADCFQITTDDPLAPGIKTDYWSPTVMGIVKTVNSETYAPGVETTVLTNFTLNWLP